jgi:hypothetical protein
MCAEENWQSWKHQSHLLPPHKLPQHIITTNHCEGSKHNSHHVPRNAGSWVMPPTWGHKASGRQCYDLNSVLSNGQFLSTHLASVVMYQCVNMICWNSNLYYVPNFIPFPNSLQSDTSLDLLEALTDFPSVYISPSLKLWSLWQPPSGWGRVTIMWEGRTGGQGQRQEVKWRQSAKVCHH